MDVQLLEKDGTVLLEKPVEFEPRDLPNRFGRGRPRPHARYEWLVPDPPKETARIRVIAHDEPHVPNPT